LLPRCRGRPRDPTMFLGSEAGRDGTRLTRRVDLPVSGPGAQLAEAWLVACWRERVNCQKLLRWLRSRSFGSRWGMFHPWVGYTGIEILEENLPGCFKVGEHRHRSHRSDYCTPRRRSRLNETRRPFSNHGTDKETIKQKNTRHPFVTRHLGCFWPRDAPVTRFCIVPSVCDGRLCSADLVLTCASTKVQIVP
jgi:hypothetical protein